MIVSHLSSSAWQQCYCVNSGHYDLEPGYSSPPPQVTGLLVPWQETGHVHARLPWAIDIRGLYKHGWQTACSVKEGLVQHITIRDTWKADYKTLSDRRPRAEPLQWGLPRFWYMQVLLVNWHCPWTEICQFTVWQISKLQKKYETIQASVLRV
jgi:hypothetical protein